VSVEGHSSPTTPKLCPRLEAAGVSRLLRSGEDFCNHLCRQIVWQIEIDPNGRRVILNNLPQHVDYLGIVRVVCPVRDPPAFRDNDSNANAHRLLRPPPI